MKQLKLLIQTNIQTQTKFVESLELLKAKGKSKEYYFNLGKLENYKEILNLINQLENE